MARGGLFAAVWAVSAGLLLGAAGCRERAPKESAPAAPTVEEAASCGDECDARCEGAVRCAPAEPAVDDCAAPIPIYRDGRNEGAVCRDRAADLGLAILDLSDDWVPRVLQGGPDAGPVAYAARYRRIAAETFGDDETWDRERLDRYFELYGIFPTLSVVGMRLGDAARHRCHDEVDDAALERLSEGVDTWRPLAEQRADRFRIAGLDRQLEAVRAAQGLARVEELAADPVHGRTLALRDRLVTRGAAIAAMQAHLRCEGLLEAEAGREGLVDGETIRAMQLYHRRHMVVSWQLDEATRDVLTTDSRELDFLTALRVLRERVVDATGLLEDGTASGLRVPVVDRVIDTAVFAEVGAARGGGAPDRIGLATDAAARALGWLDPEAARTSIAAGLPDEVAVALPPLPEYHAPHMELRVEIDRGDVWYDFPFVPNGDRMMQPRDRLPATTVYVVHGGRRIALVRWPTTIGGWQPERLGDGSTRLLYKESPAGPVIWRDVVAAPRWIPPRSTPTRDLLRPRLGGGWTARHDTFGPHYASAYGLTMMVHHRVDQPLEGEAFLTDQGIRSHGSVSYDSILDGFSHGCHRLHNHRAVRLAGFLLAHRRHAVRGDIPLDFHRRLVWRGRRFDLSFDTRGYQYELTPPVEVEVLAGTPRGHARSPRPPQRPTRPMLKRYQ